ncbi:FAD-binding oxidoreductase [Nocardioides sp.]|uniref:FAD-binding oxidoreductase n=1 Tax=Nocardioides sp. TaxID=35761 RepID=UPI003783D10A
MATLPLEELRANASTVIDSVGAMDAYAHDHCLTADFGNPAVVVLARSADEVMATINFAARHRVPVVTRGAGTGLAGGANAIEGCILLDLSRMNRILDIDPVARTASVEPGVINGDLDRAARRHGLRYVPDPGSRAISSIGGNLATNAGGMCCAKYGVTGDHVMSVTAVTGGGESIRTGGTTRKNVVGLDLTRLLVGSEGTLAVFVEALVRLHPIPSTVATLAANFADTRSAVDAVAAWTEVAIPAAVELMDSTTVRAVNQMKRMQLDESAGAVVLAQFDDPDATRTAELCESIAIEHGAETYSTDDADDGEAMMAARRAAYPALEALGTTLLDDVTVATHRLPDLLEAIHEIASETATTIGTFGHLADGNLHPTIVYDPQATGAKESAIEAFHLILDAALALDGSISGEHGIGSLKTGLVALQAGGVEVAIMHKIKQAFDPEGILNPGRAY